MWEVVLSVGVRTEWDEGNGFRVRFRAHFLVWYSVGSVYTWYEKAVTTIATMTT